MDHLLVPASYSSLVLFFFFKQKTAYEIGTGDWSSDVCSSDLIQVFFLSEIFGSDLMAFFHSHSYLCESFSWAYFTSVYKSHKSNVRSLNV